MTETMVNNNLKEYYIKLQTLYNNAANMLTAINQSLTSKASQVSVEVYDSNNNVTTVRIPSFLYMDNKLEQLETTVNNLFDMPETGEAWFANTGNMYKLELVRSNTAPLIPDLNTTKIVGGSTLNTFVKDLVSPRTFLKVNIENLPSNITEMYMKKIIFLNTSIYTELLSRGISSYTDYKAALYNYTNGVDYEEYDSVLKMPVKEDKYNSEFVIESIVQDSYFDDATTTKLRYKLQLNTLEYTNRDDASQVYTLYSGDYVCLGNEMCIYKVVDVDYSTVVVTVEEYVGHVALQSASENSEMILTKYNYDYSEYNYIEVPVEENQFILVFLGTIYNGVKSQLSDGMLFDLSTIYMTNKDGSYMVDNSGNKINYITYYNQYCNNIGDLILGLIQSAYPQLSNYNAYQLKQLQESDEITKLVSGTFNTENTLQVLPINNHIFEDGTVDNIKNYHTQKTSIQSQLNALVENISTTNNTLINTDWSQETTTTQDELRSKLQNYYNERLTLEQQLNAVINEINTLSKENNINDTTKYRIRGVTNITELDKYVKSITNSKLNIIGLEVEYKYKSISKNTTSTVTINNNTFTDWNRLNNIDRQRKLTFNETTNEYTLEFVNYDSTANIIKWNQIDIPINQSEDVIIRIRYKYNVGQPFVNIYSPWSEELTVSFPAEYTENVEVSTIVTNNNDDVINAKFTSKLINDGYEQHITNSIVSNNQTFYHSADNIYSGFNTSENSLISLKSKLESMDANIAEYIGLVQTESQKKLNVYLQYDEKQVLLNSNSTNRINIYNTDHITDKFIKKEMNLVFKNTGTVPFKLYSILPGNIDTDLGVCNIEQYNSIIKNYYRVPVFVGDVLSSQKLGQWIYFRETNPYTGISVYYNTNTQIKLDYSLGQKDKELTGINCANEYFCKDNNQLGFANKNFNMNFNYNLLGFIDCNDVLYPESDSDEITDINQLVYKNSNNICAYKYEDISGLYTDGTSKTTTIYLDKDTSISQFSGYSKTVNPYLSEIKKFDGAFLFTNVETSTTLLTDGSYNGYIEIPVGESITVPIVFEYFISGLGTTKQISKTMIFDIKNSLVKNPSSFIINLTAYYDNSLETTIDSFTVISDSATS